MPHKHTRRDKDPSTYDLPPTLIAKPLPVAAPKQSRQRGKPAPKKPSAAAAAAAAAEDKTGVKRKRDAKKDDVPRAFKRLMAFSEGKKFRSGLDDGTPAGAKKQKAAKAAPDKAGEAKRQPPPPPELTIKPGERLSDFAARVDAALPVGGLINKTARGGKDPLGLKTYRTKTEKKLHKLYDQWRQQDARFKEKRQEEMELAEDEEMENEAAGVSWKVDVDAVGPEAGAGAGKKKKKGKRARMVGEAADGGSDPWAEIKKKRGEGKIGLNDVAKAPPEFKTLPRKKLTVGGAMVDVDGIPKAAGSLRRREELQGVRDEVVASYRKLMEERKTRTQT